MADNGEQLYNSLSQGLQKILAELEKRLMKDNTYHLEHELLKKFVNGKGNIIGSSVLPEHFPEIKEQLLKQRIPFTAIPGQDGSYCILVRESEKEKLLQIEEAVMARDTRYAKELEIKNALNIMKNQGSKYTTVYKLDKDMAEIAKEKLYQSGLTFSSFTDPKDPSKVNLVLFPNTLYRENGMDSELFELKYALLQTKTSDLFLSKNEIAFNKDLKEQLEKGKITIEEYKEQRIQSPVYKIREEQAQYDRRQIDNFIKAAKKGQNVILGDYKGKGEIYLESAKGDIYIVNNNTGERKPINYTNEDTLDNLRATLSKHTEKIYDMKVFDTQDYNKYLKDTRTPFDQLPQKYQDDQIRPAGKYLKHNDAINTAFENYINIVNQEANKNIRDKAEYTDPGKMAELKHQEIIKILNDPNFKPRQDCLENLEKLNSGNYIVDVQQLYDEFVENFADEHQNSDYELEVKNISVRELHKIVVDQEGHIEKEFEPEYEHNFD